MHPFLKLDETGVWPHYHRKIYKAYGKVFNLKRHGWLNIQSFHLNMSYQKEVDAIKLHNHLVNLCAYLPAITASSPIFEGKNGPDIDNRLIFYKENQKEVPSVAGDIVPEYAYSLNQYKNEVIGKYSKDLVASGADKTLLNREWVNSRGIIFRFDRRALEIRVMDEQECVKSDVALACFIRAVLRGLLESDAEFLPHGVLLRDFSAVIKDGLNAIVSNSHGKIARDVCRNYLNVAFRYADSDEKKYLYLIKRRIEEGNLSNLIRSKIQVRENKTCFKEAVVDVYSTLIKCLRNNEPF
jgi:gamma-glutamyl:cysteine ligase YbdK (ATP-grasp superfamily)